MDDVSQTAFVEPGKTAELTFRNRPLGGLLIKKKDSVTGEPISGVVFKVTHSNGTVVGTGNGEFATDAGGFISIPDLEAGTYIVQEVKAKQGYVLDNSVKTIEVKDHQTYNLDFYNQPYGKLIVNLSTQILRIMDGASSQFNAKGLSANLFSLFLEREYPVAYQT